MRADPVASWAVVVGLMLVKPQTLLDKQNAHDDLALQDMQLAAIHELQVYAFERVCPDLWADELPNGIDFLIPLHHMPIVPLLFQTFGLGVSFLLFHRTMQD